MLFYIYHLKIKLHNRLNYRIKGYGFILSGIILLAAGGFWAVCNISVIIYDLKNHLAVIKVE